MRPDTYLSPYDMNNGKQPAWDQHSHYFGEMALVKQTTIIQAKLDNKDSPAIGDFHKVDKSEIATQFASITFELIQMYDTDEDVTPVDEDGKKLPNKTHLEDDKILYVSFDCPTMIE
jgi:hypothetical protein